MVHRIIAPALVVSGVLSSIAFAQDVGSNAYIDMYFNDGRASTPVITHGKLEERSILKRGDALKPAEKGAVLRYINSFSSATLAPQASTASTRLDGKQEIFYFRSGHGTAEAAGETAKIVPNVASRWSCTLSANRPRRAFGPIPVCWFGMRTLFLSHPATECGRTL
jgi:hypothetical protein